MADNQTNTHSLRDEELTWRESKGSIVVLDQRRWVYLSLNGSGATLWTALAAEGATTTQLVARLQEEYGIDEERARTDVEAFLAMLSERELLST